MHYQNQARTKRVIREYFELKNMFIKFSHIFEDVLSKNEELNAKYGTLKKDSFTFSAFDDRIEVKFTIRVSDDQISIGQLSFNKILPRNERKMIHILFFDEEGNVLNPENIENCSCNFRNEGEVKYILFEFLNKYINNNFGNRIINNKITELINNE